VATLGPYKVHPFAEAFPLIDGEERNDLILDVKTHGLRQPIVLSHDGTTLIDGRNRWHACQAAGIEPRTTRLPADYTDEMTVDFIVSVNVARRQLNPGQRAMIALEYEKAIAETVKRGRPAATEEKRADLPSFPERARDRAAQVTGASGRAVAQAKAVQRDAPDLAEQVRAGQLALDAADRQRKARVAAMPKPEPLPTRVGPVLLTLRTHDGKEVSYPQPQSKATFNQTAGPGISWANWSWNPVTGCLHGCDYCYAREIATSERFKSAYPAGFAPLFHHERLDAPANTVVPAQHRDDPAWRRVFVCSMADLYGRWVPDEWIEQVHTAMCASPQWQYITLTKFPARYVGLTMPPGAWVGTSVDEQKRVRIAEDAFRRIEGAAVRWLSLEPLREPLEFTDLSMFDWVVIGAQTETRQPSGTVPAFAPPFEWVARIVAQAREAGCRIHLKPNLSASPGMQMPDEYPEVTFTSEHGRSI
jgi:protein gp37/ParB-like chromosome segregation protein Spo0J